MAIGSLPLPSGGERRYRCQVVGEPGDRTARPPSGDGSYASPPSGDGSYGVVVAIAPLIFAYPRFLLLVAVFLRVIEHFSHAIHRTRSSIRTRVALASRAR
ncbi:MAG: hypothetical protein ACK6A7_20050, partial [Planctomycetota bacterium]